MKTTTEFIAAIREAGYKGTLVAEMSHSEYVVNPDDIPITEIKFIFSYWNDDNGIIDYENTDNYQLITSTSSWDDVLNKFNKVFYC